MAPSTIRTGWRARATEAAGGWRAQAACLTLDPALFFPDRLAYLKKDPSVATAKAACLRCPVREECLRTAMESGENVGIWGGLAPGERVNLHRRQRRADAAQQETGTDVPT
jgi:WhiB family transcriptional regulator, redox-sensing transcriptional regulator